MSVAPAIPSADLLHRERHVARPKVAVDTVLFAIQQRKLKTYLVRLRRGPARGKWAFPGGLVRIGELLDDAARRELRASTGLADAYLEQLFTFGDPSRDPHSHVVSVAYMALIPDAGVVTGPSSKYGERGWFEVKALPPLAYDHSLMAAYAFKRLRSKLEYSNIAYALLPRVFTFAEFEEALLADSRPADRSAQLPAQDSRDGAAPAAQADPPRTTSPGRPVRLYPAEPPDDRNAIIR